MNFFQQIAFNILSEFKFYRKKKGGIWYLTKEHDYGGDWTEWVNKKPSEGVYVDKIEDYTLN